MAVLYGDMQRRLILKFLKLLKTLKFFFLYLNSQCCTPSGTPSFKFLQPWYSQPRGNSLSSTDQPQCLLSTPAHRKLPWFPPQTFTSPHPPPTPFHHFNYYDLPASQSGSFMLPIQDYTTPTGNIHCSVMGRRNAPRSMSQ
ncbi:hypothetical protein TNCV_452981 [Trichonephila clavipes]|nr:hypothetical protein TNCV_452981 [Trichonephila clavipes]